MYGCYYDIIENCIKQDMADKEIIKAVFSHYGIRSYHEKNGRFYNIDACIMKHLRQDIREVRKNIDFQKKCVEA